MPTAPLVERQGQLQSYGAPEVQYQRPVQGIGAGLEAVGKVAGDYTEKAIQRGNEVRMIEAQRALDEWETKSLFDPKDGAFSKKGKDAFGTPESVQQSYSQFVEQYKGTLANQDQIDAFDKMTVQRWGNIAPRVQTHVRQEMDTYSTGQAKAAVESGVNRAALYWNDDKTVEETISSIEGVIEAQGISRGLSAEEIASDKAKAASAARMAQLTMLADRDPRRALEYADKNVAKFYGEDIVKAQKLVSVVREAKEVDDVIKNVAAGPLVGQDNIIQFVMSEKIEGGDKVHIDSDGGTTKFGINHKHNDMTPEEVSGLTQEQALAKYKEKYWTPMGIDNLSPSMQIVAFDAAVNHGADAHTKQMIEEANGDPMKLIDIRAKYYQKLAIQDPEKNGPQLRGWMNRLATIRAQVEAAQGNMPSLAEAYAKIDANTTNPEVAAKAKAEYKSRLDAIEQQRKQREDEAARQVAEYEARGETPPSTLIAELNPQKKIDRQQKQYDPAEYERVRNQVTFGFPVDLEQYRWRFSAEQFNELASMQGNPETQMRARTIDKLARDKESTLFGVFTDKKANLERVDRYRRLLSSSVDAHEKVTGKKATPEDIKKISKELTTSQSGASMFVRDNGEDQAIIDGIPRAEGQYMIGGKPVEYPDLIAALSITARDNNLPVTPTTLVAIYDELKKQGKIADKYK